MLKPITYMVRKPLPVYLGPFRTDEARKIARECLASLDPGDQVLLTFLLDDACNALDAERMRARRQAKINILACSVILFFTLVAYLWQ
jgi:hypothetical protein